jgi:preprotein translocase subunit SecA
VRPSVTPRYASALQESPRTANLPLQILEERDADLEFEKLGEHAQQIMSFVMLSVIDERWKDHLYDLDHLKASIGFRGWGQPVRLPAPGAHWHIQLLH